MRDTPAHELPYWRLSGFYLFYFAALGALVPFWGLYLESLGFTPSDIGELMAVIMSTRIIAPNIWAWFADHTGRRMRVVRLASFAGALCFAGVFLGHSYWWLALVMAAFSFFWNASLPQFEATLFSYLKQDTHRYSSVRLWGSIGFILTVAALGRLFEHFSLSLLPIVVFTLFVGIWLFSLTVSDYEHPHPHHYETSLWAVLKNPAVLALLAACFLMQAGHGAYYSFYSIYLEEHGYSRRFIGEMWAVGVVAEVGLFLIMHRLMKRFSLRILLTVSLLLAALRWWLIGFFIDNSLIIASAQTLHAASFAVYHAAAIQLVHQYFPGRLRGRGQALYTSLSFGAGGAAGTLISGYSWESLGGAASFYLAVLMCLAGCFVAWHWVREAGA